MATKRTGLGRGIGSLIPTSETSRAADVFFNSSTQQLVEVPGAKLVTLDPSTIRPNSKQPRSEFREDDLNELIHSVKEFGVLQPIVVRTAEVVAGVQQYELVMGERRLRATKAAGLDTIPAVVRDTADEDMLRDALLENLHRSELNPLEEASAYQQLLEDFGTTQDQLAERIGRSRSQISNTIRLLKLPEKVQQQVAAGVLSFGHAKVILSAKDIEAQTQLANKIINNSLSVREAEALLQESKPAPTKPKPGKRTDQLGVLAQRLGDRLDTRAQIKLGNTKGLISIEFSTIADLNRILDEIGVDRNNV